MTRCLWGSSANLVLFLLVGLCGGCALQGDPDAVVPEPSLEVRSDLSRELTPPVPPQDMQTLVHGNTKLALTLYRELRTEPGNVFYSPFSVSLALAMMYAGARGETASQMATTLHFDLQQERLHPAFNALDLSLTAGSAGEGDFVLRVANALWGQTGYGFLGSYLDTLAQNYGAGVRLTSFVADPEGSRQTINGWVSENTEEMIPELLPRGSIDTLTRMVLTNAIYFLADWQTPFPPELTQPSDFHTTARTVTVPMMGTTRYLRHGEGIGYKTLELPYKGNRISMLIFLPDEGELAAFEQSLDTGRLDEILAGMSTRYVMVRLPRFEIEAKASLAGLLSRLGMPLAFTEAADFSGVNGGGDPLFIKAVEHKAVVRVDEKGTEAAAATGVVAGTTSVPPQPVPFIADRPFLFVIRDGQTGTLLFVGRLSDPPEASGGAGLSAKEQKRPLQLRK